jgi:hypothetical protein
MVEAPPEQPTPARRRTRLITLGGTNVQEIGQALKAIWHHKHIWNVTWPSLGSRPFPLERMPDGPEFAELQRFLQRETEKTFPAILRDGEPDVVLLSIGQNVLNDYIVQDGRVIPDFTTPFFLPPGRLNGRPRPNAADFVGQDHRVVTLDAPDYGSLIKQGLYRAYFRILRPLMRRGVRIILHAHVPATQALTTDGLVDDANDLVRRQMAVIDDLTAYARTLPGLEFVEQIPQLNFTSDDAPNGRWAFHPIKDHHAMQAYRIAQMVAPERAEAVLLRYLFDNRQSQLKLRTRALQAEAAHNDAARGERDLWRRLYATDVERQTHERALANIKRSFSWRLTAPLRALSRGWTRKDKKPSEA